MSMKNLWQLHRFQFISLFVQQLHYRYHKIWLQHFFQMGLYTMQPLCYMFWMSSVLFRQSNIYRNWLIPTKNMPNIITCFYNFILNIAFRYPHSKMQEPFLNSFNFILGSIHFFYIYGISTVIFELLPEI